MTRSRKRILLVAGLVVAVLAGRRWFVDVLTRTTGTWMGQPE